MPPGAMCRRKLQVQPRAEPASQLHRRLLQRQLQQHQAAQQLADARGIFHQHCSCCDWRRSQCLAAAPVRGASGRVSEEGDLPGGQAAAQLRLPQQVSPRQWQLVSLWVTASSLGAGRVMVEQCHTSWSKSSRLGSSALPSTHQSPDLHPPPPPPPPRPCVQLPGRDAAGGPAGSADEALRGLSRGRDGGGRPAGPPHGAGHQVRCMPPLTAMPPAGGGVPPSHRPA